MPESLFEPFKKRVWPNESAALPIPVENLEPVAMSPELVTAHEKLESVRKSFLENYEAVSGQLPPGEAARFACVRDLPDMFEQKIRAVAAMPEYRGRDFADSRTIAYLKSHLLNYNVRDSGPIFHTMESVLRENAVSASGSPIDIAFHQFFRSAPGELIEAIAQIIARERLESRENSV